MWNLDKNKKKQEKKVGEAKKIMQQQDLTPCKMLDYCQAWSQCWPCWQSNWNVVWNDRDRWHKDKSVVHWEDYSILQKWWGCGMKKIAAAMLKELWRKFQEKQNTTNRCLAHREKNPLFMR